MRGWPKAALEKRSQESTADELKSMRGRYGGTWRLYCQKLLTLECTEAKTGRRPCSVDRLRGMGREALPLLGSRESGGWGLVLFCISGARTDQGGCQMIKAVLERHTSLSLGANFVY